LVTLHAYRPSDQRDAPCSFVRLLLKVGIARSVARVFDGTKRSTAL
jgi:hypothetical protein